MKGGVLNTQYDSVYWMCFSLSLDSICLLILDIMTIMSEACRKSPTYGLTNIIPSHIEMYAPCQNRYKWSTYSLPSFFVECAGVHSLYYDVLMLVKFCYLSLKLQKEELLQQSVDQKVQDICNNMKLQNDIGCIELVYGLPGLYLYLRL